MTHKHPYLLEVEADYRRQTYLNEAAVDRLAREAGLDRRWPLHKMACQLLCGLGHQLVSLGQRLEGLEAPALSPSIPSPEAISAGPRKS
jgi:hypothetical protein